MIKQQKQNKNKMLTKMMVMVPMKMIKMMMMMKAMMKMMVLMAVRPSNDGCGRRLTKKVVHWGSMELLCTAADLTYCTVQLLIQLVALGIHASLHCFNLLHCSSCSFNLLHCCALGIGASLHCSC